MSSRPLLIIGIVAGVAAGVALFVLALVVVAIDGTALSASVMTLLVLGTIFGFVLDSTWLCLALGRLAKLDRRHDGEEDEGDEGWGRPRSDEPRPRPPSGDPEWWPEFERDFGAYLAERRSLKR